MKEIKYEQTWCDNITPCPYFNKEDNQEGKYVGSYECYTCPFFGEFTKDKNTINCNYEV